MRAAAKLPEHTRKIAVEVMLVGKGVSSRWRTLGGVKEIFRGVTAQIGIIQVQVNRLDSAKQLKNMHRVLACYAMTDA